MHSPVTDAAIVALGAASGSDWKLTPERHAQSLPPAAGALARVLARPGIQDIVRSYRDADTRADTAQTGFRKAGRIGIWARLLALSIGAVALVVGADVFDAGLRVVFIILQALALLVSYLAAFWVTRRRPFLSWMEARGEAELARVAYFDAVTQAEETAGQSGELPLLPLQLEYFRRYQLDVQKDYFNGRAQQHLNDARRTTVMRRFVLFLIALAALACVYQFGLAQSALEGDDAMLQRLFIAVMTVASAMQLAFTDVSLMELNERNAARYAASFAKLTELAGAPLIDARAAAAENRKSAVASFCATVQNELSNEHRAWAILRDVAPKPVALAFPRKRA